MSQPLDLINRVEKSIFERSLFGRGEHILVAVSGGVDSMVLLYVVSELAKIHRWKVTVAHFNHHLRGRSSAADEKFVRAAAERLGWEFVVGRADVKAFARKNKLSIEMAARKLRHEFIARTATKLGIRQIALAHHADDQIELFFLRVLRGSSNSSLAGMKWKNPSPSNSKIVLARPLLETSKTAIEEFASANNIPFRKDASNSDSKFQRNRIRNELLPLLKTNYQPALGSVISRQMQIIGAEAEFVTEQACAWLRKKIGTFDALAVAVQRRVLYEHLINLGLSPNFELIEGLREFPEKVFSVSDKLIRRDTAGQIHFSESAAFLGDDEVTEMSIVEDKGRRICENVEISWLRKPLMRGTFHAKKGFLNCENFDADKLGSDLTLRHWRSGDRFQSLGMVSAAKLQDILVNRKVPHVERHRLLIGVCRGEIFWVEGLPPGECFKLDAQSRYQLQWRWKRL